MKYIDLCLKELLFQKQFYLFHFSGLGTLALYVQSVFEANAADCVRNPGVCVFPGKGLAGGSGLLLPLTVALSCAFA